MLSLTFILSARIKNKLPLCILILLPVITWSQSSHLNAELVKIDSCYEAAFEGQISFDVGLGYIRQLKEQRWSENDQMVLRQRESIYLFKTNEIEASETMLDPVLDYWQSRDDTLQEQYAIGLSTKGAISEAKGDRFKSIEYFQRGTDLHQELQVDYNPFYAQGYEELCYLQKISGMFDRSLSCYDALKTYWVEKEDWSWASSIAAQMADNYSFMDKLEEAESNYIESLEYANGLLGKGDLTVVSSIYGYGLLLVKMGDYKKAEKQFFQALEELELSGTGKEVSSIYQGVYNGLGMMYYRSRNLTESLKALEKSRGHSLIGDGEDSEVYAATCGNLALLYSQNRQYDRAEELFKIALRKERSRVKNPNIIYSIMSLAQLYSYTDRDSAAIEQYLEARQLSETYYGKNFKAYESIPCLISTAYVNIGDYTQAEEEYKKCVSNELRLANQAISFMSERQLQNYVNNEIFASNRIKTLGLLHNSTSLDAFLFDLSLEEKGILLNASRRLQSFAVEHPDSSVRSDFLDLQMAKKNRIKLLTIDNIASTALDSVNQIIDLIEKRLAVTSSLFQDQFNEEKNNLKNISSTLAADEIVVDFTYFNLLHKNVADSIVYAASILDGSTKQVDFIPLCSASDLSLLTKKQSNRIDYVDALYKSSDKVIIRGKSKASLDQLIWKELNPYLEKKRKIYFSTAGILSRINHLAIPRKDGQSLADQFEMVNMMNVKSMAKTSPEYKNNDMVIYGGITYDLDTTSTNSMAVIEPSFGAVDEVALVLDRALTATGWNELPWSAQECNEIKQMATSAKMNVTYFNGMNASEASFKSIDQNNMSPRVIHLATHGFFFPDPASGKTSDDAVAYEVSENPMLRSGILLAGGNAAWMGNRLDGQEDGILTAYEIANMNLTNTQLVVLSACETGLGDIQGTEGVYGLQRAFRQAGVDNLIMSLWKVSDRETAEFMSLFYTNWLTNKMTIRAAFAAAQSTMKNLHPEPHLWAGFILLE